MCLWLLFTVNWIQCAAQSTHIHTIHLGLKIMNAIRFVVHYYCTNYIWMWVKCTKTENFQEEQPQMYAKHFINILNTHTHTHMYMYYTGTIQIYTVALQMVSITINSTHTHGSICTVCTDVMMIYANSMRTDLITIKNFQYDDDDDDVKERKHTCIHFQFQSIIHHNYDWI